MTNIITDAFTNAILADATYALDKDVVDGFDGAALKSKLSTRMTSGLAQYISENFRVVTNINSSDVFSSGFDATVWQEIKTGSIYVSTRGTDFVFQDLINDADLTAGNGAPARQIVDMVNWWLRISTPTHLYVKQIALFDVPISSSDYFYETTPVKGKGLVSSSATVTVNGHSLGGALATTFARLIDGSSNNIAAVNTFNSAGFSPASWLLFSQIQALLGFSNAGTYTNNNYYADNGLSATTRDFLNIQFGSRVPLSQENSAELISNHYMYKITDLLALGACMSTFDSSLNFSILNKFLDSAANKTEASLEYLLDSFRKMIGLYTVATSVGDVSGNAASREEYYANINLLNQALTTGSLSGTVNKVLLVDAVSNSVDARSDYGQFLALYFLSPFAFDGQESDIKNFSPEIYALWNADKTLSAQDRNNGKANFSDIWYEDRVAMLTAQLSRNMLDKPNDTEKNSGPQDIHYYDSVGGDAPVVSESKSNSTEIQLIRFGNATKANSLDGGAYNDRVYGGTLVDVLHGHQGHDYIEGGAGNDKLFGEAGADQLYGGADNDELNGGDGNDILIGGTGTDKYIFTGSFGQDMIKNDTDGTLFFGATEATATQLTQLTQTAEGSIIYYDNTSNPKYQGVIINEGDSQSLIISTVVKTGNSISATGNSVTIKNWSAGALGLTLKNATAITPTPKFQTINGNTGSNAITLANLRDATPDIDLTNTALRANGGAGSDVIMGMLNTNDILSGGADDDYISGGFTTTLDANAQYTMSAVSATPGIDMIHGDGGNDHIFVSSGGSVAHGDDGDDILDAQTGMYFQFNNVAAVSGTNVNNHPALTRDQVWTDVNVPAYINFRVEKVINPSGSFSYNNHIDYFKNFTSSFVEYSSVSGVKFIGKLGSNGSAVNPSGSSTGYSFGGTYSLAYNYSTNNGLVPSTSGLAPVMVAGAIFQPATGRTYEEFANVKGANLYGDKGDDYLEGGLYADYLSGGSADDIGSDKDTIFGGEGNDILDGGADVDVLIGSEGNDLLIGGKGDDLLYGSVPIDRVGAQDNDTLYGGEGNDYLDGGRKNDYLDGGIESDTLYGGEGNDYLYGGDDDVRDYLNGGDQDDILVVGKNDMADGGSGKNIYIWDTHKVTTQPQAMQLSALNVNNEASSVAHLSSLVIYPKAIEHYHASHIESIEGNNTLALVGVRNIADLGFEISGKNLLINANDQQIILNDGATNSPIHLTTGTSVEQVVATAVNLAAITDDAFLNGENLLAQSQITTAGVMLTRIDSSVSLTAATANTYLAGGLINDMLTAHENGSRLIGGKGDDQLYGRLGDDVYLVRKGDGNDIIFDGGGVNLIKFDKHIVSSQVRLIHSGNDLLIQVSDEQTVTVRDMFAYSGQLDVGRAIQKIQFYDNTVWDVAAIKQHVMSSTDGNDVIGSFEGAEILSGGKGNDRLMGYAGNDIYRYTLGDGNDVIEDSAGIDQLELNGGILPGQVTAIHDGNNDLILKLAGGIKVTIVDHFYESGSASGNAIESIKFSDGSIWNLTKIQQEVLTETGQLINGTTDNNILVGDTGKDIFTGGKGNDQLVGNVGHDVYKYALGDGNDIITDIKGKDRIELGAGITQAQTIVRANGFDVDFYFNDNGKITVKDMLAPRVDPSPIILAIVNELQTNWMAQTEALIEQHYGLIGSGDITVKFHNGAFGAEPAYVGYSINPVTNAVTNLTLNFDLNSFIGLPIVGVSTYDRLIAHEMTHAVMATKVNTSTMPGWFLEGAAEFIHGADERVRNDLRFINYQSNFNAYFKTTVGSPSTSEGYSVAYIAVKLLDYEIRANGGSGIRELFDLLKTGKTLDQSLTALSAAHNGMNGLWHNLASYENHVRADAVANFGNILHLNNADTGSVGGSDTGNSTLDGSDVVPNKNIGPSQHFNLIVPEEYVYTYGTENRIETVKFIDGSIWNLDKILLEIEKGTKGTDADDFITGSHNSDLLIGGKGNDTLHGVQGDDVYKYNVGDGNDIITDTGGLDKIEFGPGILSAQIKATRDTANNLVLTLFDNSTLTIVNAFDAAGNFTSNAIETLNFEDGSSWAQYQIREDVIRNSESIIDGTPGVDFLTGAASSDTLTGGLGNDDLRGGDGNDTYVYSLGDGKDTIVDTGGVDVLKFTNLNEADVRARFDGFNNLVLTVKNSEQIIVKSMYNSASGALTPSFAIEKIQFANGAAWNLNQIKQEVLKPKDGFNDQIYASELNDTLIGGLGYDALYGGYGNDIYQFNSGDGVDFISDTGGSDKIKFGAGVNPNDLMIVRRANGSGTTQGNTLLFFANGDQITLYQDALNANNKIELLEFSNGEVWDAAKIDLRVASTNTRTNVLVGTNQWDVLAGDTAQANILLGLNGADDLTGGDGNDILIASVGGDDGDILDGKAGADTFYIAPSPGNFHNKQYIQGFGDEGDRIVFDASIRPSDVKVYVSGANAHDHYLNNGEMYYWTSIGSNEWTLDLFAAGVEVKINDVLTDTVFGGRPKLYSTPVGTVHFIDGTIWTYDQLIQMSFAGSAADDNLHAFDKAEVISGLAGNDTIYSYGGDDTISGGTGDDTLYGGEGYDRYEISLNDGRDTIFDWSSQLEFGQGINPSSVIVSRSVPIAGSNFGEDLILTVGANQSVTVKNIFNAQIGSANTSSETIKFFDGTTWSLEKIISLISPNTNLDTTAPQLPSAYFDSTGKIISGTAEVKSLVTARSSADIIIGSAVADAITGAYSITLNSALINSELVNMSAKDAAGNISAVKSINAPDITPPPQPSAVFDTAGKVITGVAEAGSIVEVKNSSNTAVLGRIAADETTGADTITLPTALINQQSVNITATDSVGNISVAKTINAPDKTAPSQPTAAFDTAGKIITGVAEVGSTVTVKNSSNTTTLGTATANATTGAYSVTLVAALINKEAVNVAAKDVAGNVSVVKTINAPDRTAPSQPTAAFDTAGKIITGVAEVGSTVTVKNSSNTTTLGTATANATTGAYSITLTTALINKQAVNVTAKDLAGNISIAKTVIAPDKTAPSQPTAAFDVSGKIINGIAEAGSTVVVKNSTNSTTLGSVVADGATGAYSITLVTALINKQSVNVTAKDLAGNISIAKTIIAPDKTAPSQPTAAFDTMGKIITGVAESGSTVVVKNSSNSTTLGSATANATTGAYSITLGTALLNNQVVNITAKDASGNVSAVKTINAPDKTAPLQPTAAFDTAGKIITGVAEVGSIVTVKNSSNVTTMGTATANATTGAYSITLVTALTKAEIVNVTAKDIAGNISVAKAITAPQVVAAQANTQNLRVSAISSQSDVLIQAMAAFAPPVAADTKSLVGYYDTNHPMLVSHS